MRWLVVTQGQEVELRYLLGILGWLWLLQDPTGARRKWRRLAVFIYTFHIDVSDEVWARDNIDILALITTCSSLSCCHLERLVSSCRAVHEALSSINRPANSQTYMSIFRWIYTFSAVLP